MSLARFLTSYRGRSLFLPAHLRGKALPNDLKNLLRASPGIWDLPELIEFGGPLIESGAVANSQRHVALRIGAKRGWYGVNGATGLLQAGLLAIAKPNEAVLMPRNVHKSIIHACLLGEITPVFFDLPFMADRGHYLPADINWFKNILNEINEFDQDIVAAVLVNPFYQGYSTDLSDFINQLHGRGLPVLVDEAHGTHFCADIDELPVSALKCGADLVVHSLHKSAAGLAQTAAIWLQGDLIDPIAIERSIAVFQTTSPSSLLLASCESSLEQMLSVSGRKKLINCINNAKETFFRLSQKGLPLIKNQDPLRLILHTAKYGLNGLEVDEWMISKGITAELPEPGCLTFCLGLASHKGLVKAIESNWNKFLSTAPQALMSTSFASPPFDLLMKPTISSSNAWRSDSKTISLFNSYERISADLISPYPPGVPMIIPGDKLDKNKVDWLIEQKSLWSDQIPSCIRVMV